MTNHVVDQPSRGRTRITSRLGALLRGVAVAANSPRAPRRILALLIPAIALGLILATSTTVTVLATTGVCIFMISLAVGVHEFCHLLVAAQGGIKVKSFYLGFGPVLTMRRWRNIEWGVRTYPLGGYVDLHGEERDEGPASFAAASPGRKLAVLLVGPISNFVLAFLILVGLALAHGFSLVQAPGVAWTLVVAVVQGTLAALGSLLPATASNPLNMPLMGLPGMVGMTSSLLAQGPTMVVVLIAVFSASIGFTNLLPIPPLDGGKAVLVLAKLALGDRYPDSAGIRLQRWSFVAIIGLMVAINGIDLVRILVGYKLPLVP